MTGTLNLWLIPILPLAGAVINGFFGKKSSRRAVSTVAVVFSGAAFAWALLAVLRFWPESNTPYQEYLTHWIRAGSFSADFAFYLDRLSVVMVLVVTGVGFLIHIYSVGYMWDDPGYYRFFSYLNLFMFFMLTLVLANNYLLMFIGWEGVGLASYLLIGFWFTKDSAASAGKKAFIVNRIGDFGFLIGLFLLIQHFGSLNFTEVFDQVKPMGVEASAGRLTAIGILLMVGACGKSAQIPLYVWLPDAMEGPTPVSALIHAATMVTAGVYMVSRSHMIFERAPIALTVVAIIGTLTALFAATIGVTQTDIKKVLAYSTVSQLGYMFMACGVGAFSAGIFHLMTHAFFKGLLFLGAGSVIHAVAGEQDMRKMGGLKTYIPITFTVMLVATLAISGIPPLAGFWSKDEILWKAYESNPVYWVIGAITALITSFYMFRLLFMTFWGDYKGISVDDHGHAHATQGHGEHGHGEPHESPMVMLVPLVILAILSFVGGFVGIHNGFEHFLEPVFGGEFPKTITQGAGNTEWLLMGISVAFAFAGLILAYILYVSKPYLPQKIADSLNGFYKAVLNKYYVDELYAAVFVKPLIDASSKVLWQGVDRKVIDDTINDAADGARHVSDEVRHMQSGNVRSYAGWIAAGAAIVIAYMTWLGVSR
jgi:NADH-quinone oxidoreductase subunit L